MRPDALNSISLVRPGGAANPDSPQYPATPPLNTKRIERHVIQSVYTIECKLPWESCEAVDACGTSSVADFMPIVASSGGDFLTADKRPLSIRSTDSQVLQLSCAGTETALTLPEEPSLILDLDAASVMVNFHAELALVQTLLPSDTLSEGEQCSVSCSTDKAIKYTHNWITEKNI